MRPGPCLPAPGDRARIGQHGGLAKVPDRRQLTGVAPGYTPLISQRRTHMTVRCGRQVRAWSVLERAQEEEQWRTR